MDLLWKSSGLDLRLSLYRCMSTDLKEGFIEVVQNAETVCRYERLYPCLIRRVMMYSYTVLASCRIQMDMSDYKSTAPFRKGLLLQWLKMQTGGSEEKMKRAQYEFTQSCAGYSVAAYILGNF